MNYRWKKWLVLYQNSIVRANELPIEKRLMWFGMAGLTIFLAWRFLIMFPLNFSQQLIKQQVVLLKGNVADYRVQVEKLKMESDIDAARARNHSLLQSINTLDQQLSSHGMDMVPIPKVTQALKDLLDSKAGLSLISLQSLPPKLLITFPVHDQDTPYQLYQHTMQLNFEGDYFNTFDYLKRMDVSQWQIFWDELDYKVENYPAAKVLITLHTINRTGDEFSA